MSEQVPLPKQRSAAARQNIANMSLPLPPQPVCSSNVQKKVKLSFDETFSDYQSVSQIFGSLQRHGNSGTKALTLQGFGTGDPNCPSFENLDELTLEKCLVSRDWCKMCTLKTLRMSEVIFRRWPLQYSHRGYGEPPIPPISIPVDCYGSLVEVRLIDVNFGNDDIEKLLTKNPAIKMLSVVKCLGTSPHFFKSLIHLKQLEEFEFKKKTNGLSYSYELKNLHKLKNLKILKMSIYDAPALEIFEGFIKNGIAIEHFEYRGGKLNDGTVSGIAKLQTLKTLKLYEVVNLNESHILRIVDTTKRLEELHIEINSAHISPDALKRIVNAANRLTCLKILAPDRFNLGVDTFQAILDTVQKRNEKNPFELTIYGDGEQSLSVPDEISKGENEKWLKVNVLNRNTNRLYENLSSKVGHPPPSRWYDSESEDDYDDEWN